MTQDTAVKSIFDVSCPRFFSVDAEAPFLFCLAQSLRHALGEEALADCVIYLPTRRAVRKLGQVFVETAPNSRASLLPRITALGDVDEDEFVIFNGLPYDEIDLLPAISSIERRLILARLVAAKDRAFSGQENWAGALAAADELGKLLDSFYTEEVSLNALKEVVPEALASHWARSLEFLEIILKAWPAHLDAIGRMDPAERRITLLRRQTALWKQAPPTHPVIVAGSTGSTPAVAELMSVVASLPKGCVILPGLDRSMGEQLWNAIDDPHPQSGLKGLLDQKLQIDYRAVLPLPGMNSASSLPRADLIGVALRPSAASDSWRNWADEFKANVNPETALRGLSLAEMANDEREADAITIKIRETIETPGKTVFLVTPDRNLARRVSLKLRRWGLIVDDSAGVPFANSPCGTFLRLVARWLSAPDDAVALLAMMRHPLFGGDLAPRERFTAINAVDISLRGLRPDGGVHGLCARIRNNTRHHENALPLLTLLESIIVELPDTSAPFSRWLQAHLSLAEQLAATDQQGGAEILWRGEDGETGASSLAELDSMIDMIGNEGLGDYAEIFDQLIANIAVRRTLPVHPRIAILGPLEARLQTADVIILGGLNEGVWPRDAAIDPFLSRGMRKDIGLPSPERRVGLSAHDFAQLAAAPVVLLTRSEKSGGKPTMPSRWIVRLKNILKGADALHHIDQSHYYAALADELDKTNYVQIAAPQPKPPLRARPKDFYVTRIETLLRDPYAVYARSVLRLEKLDELNETLDARHIGNLFHKIFERYVLEEPSGTVEEKTERLLQLFDEAAGEFGLGESHRIFWRSRALDAAKWFAAWDEEQRKSGTPKIIEDKGHWAFDQDGQQYSLSARTDRIDMLNDGTAAIYDYKTGETPPTKNQESKFSPQLPLTALILQEGGFEAFGRIPVTRFEYVRIVNRKGGRGDSSLAEGADCAQRVEEASKGLRELLAHFNDPQTAYPSQPRPQFVSDYGDYDKLARRRERRMQGGDE